jgi:hypothetical protein
MSSKSMIRPTIARLIGPFAATAALVVAAAPVLAGDGWSVQRFEEDLTARSLGRPAIALHGGVIHVALAASVERPGIRLYSIDDGDVTFDRATTKRDRQPSLAISDQGVFHLAFSRRGTGCAESPCTVGIFYARSTNGEDWTIERVHRGNKDVHPSLALDPSGRPWIYFRSQNRIVESHKSGGDWSNASIAFGCCGPDPMAGPEATVVGGQGQNAVAGGIDSISGFTRLATFREFFDGGQIVLSIFELDFIETLIVARADDAFDPDVAIDDDQNLHIAYRREGNGLWYAEIQPNGTFDRTQVATDEILGQPAVASLPDGKVLIVARNDRHRLVFRTNATGPWTGDEVPPTFGMSEAPAVATTDAGAGRVAYLRDDSNGGFWIGKHPPTW